MKIANVNIAASAKGREGGSTNRSTGKWDLLSNLIDDESASRVLVIQHCSKLEDPQTPLAGVLDGGDDPQVSHGRDFVGWSRERNIKTTKGANRGLVVGADGRETKGYER